MSGAGLLPARMAAEARRQGWRVVAFTFGEADLGGAVDRAIPSRLDELGAVLGRLRDEGASAALFSGRFAMSDVLRTDAADAGARAVMRRAGSRIDARLAEAVIGTLAGMGIEVLDQRRFVGDWLDGGGCWSARRPTETEWSDVRRGLELARLAADAHVGQTVVLRDEAVTAVEAVEGTSEAIRRGTRLGGPGAVIVKAVARDHDYRFDAPMIGLDTLEAAAAGGAAVIAIEAGRVLILDREAVVRRADECGIAIVSVGDGRSP